MFHAVQGAARALIFVVLVLSSAAIGAQGTVLTGRVVDPSGAPVAGAKVRLTDVSGAVHETATGADGRFAVENLPSGRYTVRVESPPFLTLVVSGQADGRDRAETFALSLPTFGDEVTVSATGPAAVARTDAPLRDQPISVATLPSSDLQTFGNNDLVASLQAVPNVNAFNQYGVYEYYSFRGFTDSVQAVDGVRGEGNRVRSQLSNVERVEVLKGPASVLYGSEAVGATVNIVLKKPSPYPTWDAATSFGRWNTTRASAGAGGRLFGAGALYRVDVGADRSDGFRHDESTRFNATPSVSWQVTRHDRLDVRYAFNRNALSGDAGIPVVVGADGIPRVPDVPRDRRLNTPGDFATAEDHNVRVGYTRVVTDDVVIRGVFNTRKTADEYWVAEMLTVQPPSTVEREFLYFKHDRRPVFGQIETAGRARLVVPHDILAGVESQLYRSRTTRSAASSIVTTPIDLFDPVEKH